MTVKTNIAAGLKAARKAARMNVDDVGAALGKSGKTISAWEVGRGQPDGDELIVLCKLFGVHLRDFYGEEYEELVGEGKPAPDLTPDERELVNYYRATAEIGKHSILDLARQYAEIAPAPKEGDAPSLFISRDMTDDEVDERLREYDAALKEWKAARKLEDVALAVVEDAANPATAGTLALERQRTASMPQPVKDGE